MQLWKIIDVVSRTRKEDIHLVHGRSMDDFLWEKTKKLKYNVEFCDRIFFPNAGKGFIF